MKNCALFTDCVDEITYIQVYNAKKMDIVMPMYILVKYKDNYWKISGSSWQCYGDKPAPNKAESIIDFLDDNDNNCALPNFEQKITGQTDNDRTKDVEIFVPLRYLNNFWRILKMSLTHYEIRLIITWSIKCLIITDPINH